MAPSSVHLPDIADVLLPVRYKAMVLLIKLPESGRLRQEANPAGYLVVTPSEDV